MVCAVSVCTHVCCLRHPTADLRQRFFAFFSFIFGCLHVSEPICDIRCPICDSYFFDLGPQKSDDKWIYIYKILRRLAKIRSRKSAVGCHKPHTCVRTLRLHLFISIWGKYPAWYRKDTKSKNCRMICNLDKFNDSLEPLKTRSTSFQLVTESSLKCGKNSLWSQEKVYTVKLSKSTAQMFTGYSFKSICIKVLRNFTIIHQEHRTTNCLENSQRPTFSPNKPFCKAPHNLLISLYHLSPIQ